MKQVPSARDMLLAYRALNRQNPMMAAVADDFLNLTAPEQRELLFWMCIDVAKNPTQGVPNVRPGPAN